VASCTFFTVADSRYWIGAVALVNSLRLAGHDDDVVVLDAGFTPRQRARLDGVVEVVPAPAVRAPFLARWMLPLERPGGVQVLLDADLVAVRSLAPAIEEAARGRVVAFVDRLASRGFSEWEDVAGAQAYPLPYVNSGFVALPEDLGPELLPRVREGQERVDLGAARLLGRGDVSHPFHFPDQDVLNGVLRALVPPDRLVALDHALAPTEPWDEVRVEDVDRLRCVGPGGSDPYLVHVVGAKPWLANVAPTAYETLLPRLLTGDDVTIRLRPSELPLRVRWPRLVGRDAAARRVARRLRLRKALSRLRSAPRSSTPG